MIKIEKNLSKFKTIIKALNGVGSELNIIKNLDKITLSTVNMPATMMTKVELNNSFFEEFELKENIKLDLPLFTKFVSKLKDNLTINIVDNKLILNDKFIEAYMSILDVYDSRDVVMSNDLLKNIIEKDLFQETIDDIIDISLNCKINMLTNKLLIEAGDNLQGFKKTIECVNDCRNVQSVFISSEYLVQIKKILDLSNEVEMWFNNGSPLFFIVKDKELNCQVVIARKTE